MSLTKKTSHLWRRFSPLVWSVVFHGAALLGLVLLLWTSQWKRRQAVVAVLQVELGGHGPKAKTINSRVSRRRREVPKPAVPGVKQPEPQGAPAGSESAESTDWVPDRGSESGTGSGSGATAALRDQYLSQVVQLIHEAKRYPRLALLREEQGQVLVSMDVAPDGTILNAKLEKPSPFDSLNQGALDTIRKLGKLPPLPPAFAEGMHLHIPILYQLQGLR